MGNKYLEKIAGSPFSRALAFESLHDDLKAKLRDEKPVSDRDLLRYAKTIAMKTQHNINNGFTDKINK